MGCPLDNNNNIMKRIYLPRHDVAMKGGGIDKWTNDINEETHEEERTGT